MSRLPQKKRNKGKYASNKNEDLIASFNLREIRLATWHEKRRKMWNSNFIAFSGTWKVVMMEETSPWEKNKTKFDGKTQLIFHVLLNCYPLGNWMRMNQSKQSKKCHEFENVSKAPDFLIVFETTSVLLFSTSGTSLWIPDQGCQTGTLFGPGSRLDFWNYTTEPTFFSAPNYCAR